jgi:predicted transcriptional regulator
MDPLTPLDTLCRIILRAREYEAQTPTDYDGGEEADNVDDEDEGTLSVLDDTINDSVEEELTAAFEDLGEDQLAEVLAFCWVGGGTYEAGDWDEAMEEAQSLVASGTKGAINELMDMPMLASVLESGLAAFELSCDGIGDLS